MTKICFLDVDGVLNSIEWIKNNHEAVKAATSFLQRSEKEMNPEAVKEISSLVERTNTSVVISSSWRRLHTLEEISLMLRNNGWTAPDPVDITPTLKHTSFRGDEILAWLANHPEVTTHVIFDDDGDFHPSQPLVRTSYQFGLTKAHIVTAEEILNGERKITWNTGPYTASR